MPSVFSQGGVGGGSSSSNASVGTNNITAPTSSTEIGSIDSGGKLQGASASNPIPVTLEADVVAVDAQITGHAGATLDGTAGSPSTGVLTVQGVSGGQTLPVTATQSGTWNVTNAGTFAVQSASTLAAETTKVIGTVRTLGNAGVALDAVLGATKPANVLQVGGNDGTNAYAVPLGGSGSSVITSQQMGSNATLVTWTSATSLNATGTILSSASGLTPFNTVVVELDQDTGTFTAGAVTFEGSMDGTDWTTIIGYGQDGTVYSGAITLVTTTTTVLQFSLTGWLYFRVRLSTAITGTGTLVVQYGADATPSVSGQVVRNIPRKFSTILYNASLTSGQTYTSSWYDSNGDSTLAVFATVAQAAGGTNLYIEGTNDQSNIFTLSSSTLITANLTISALITCRYWRVRLLSGNTITYTLSVTFANAGNTAIFGQKQATNTFPTLPTYVIGSIFGGQDNLYVGILDNPQYPQDYAAMPVMSCASIGYNASGTPLTATRTPNKFFTTTVSSGTTASNPVWTPTSGRKFRLMRYQIELQATAAISGGAALVTFQFVDASTNINIAHDIYVPATASPAIGAPYVSPWFDLGNGVLSAAANNVLNVALSTALTAGAFRVNVCGTEE